MSESNQKKIFHELDDKVGFKRFWAMEAEMNPTGERRKFFMNSTYIMYRE